MGDDGVAELCVAIAQLRRKRAHRRARPPTTGLEPLVRALRSAHQVGVRRPLALLCTEETAQRIEAARTVLAQPATPSARHAAWEALSTALAAAQTDALHAWSSVGLDGEAAILHDGNRLWGQAEQLAEAARNYAEKSPACWPIYQCGDRVIIFGLASRPELNGESCTLRKYVESKSRWVAQLDGDMPSVLLRPFNLLRGEVGSGDDRGFFDSGMDAASEALRSYETLTRGDASTLKELCEKTDASSHHVCMALSHLLAQMQYLGGVGPTGCPNTCGDGTASPRSPVSSKSSLIGPRATNKPKPKSPISALVNEISLHRAQPTSTAGSANIAPTLRASFHMRTQQDTENDDSHTAGGAAQDEYAAVVAAAASVRLALTSGWEAVRAERIVLQEMDALCEAGFDQPHEEAEGNSRSVYSEECISERQVHLPRSGARFEGVARVLISAAIKVACHFIETARMQRSTIIALDELSTSRALIAELEVVSVAPSLPLAYLSPASRSVAALFPFLPSKLTSEDPNKLQAVEKETSVEGGTAGQGVESFDNKSRLRPCHISRENLRQKQCELAAAVSLETNEPKTVADHGALNEVTSCLRARDQTRLMHIAALKGEEVALLRCADCSSVEDLDAAVREATAATKALGDALKAAREEIARMPRALGELEEAVNQVDIVVADGRAIDGMGRLTGNVKIGGQALAPLQMARSAFLAYLTTAAEAALLRTASPTIAASVDPAGFLFGFDFDGEIPAQALLLAAADEAKARQRRMHRLIELRSTLVWLIAEREEEEEAMRVKVTDISARLADARLACRRAQRRLEPALLQLRYLREDGVTGPELVVAEAAVSTAMAEARQADACLSEIHATLCLRLPALPELAPLVPDAAPRELLPIFHPQRSLKMYTNLRPLGGSASRHTLRYGEIDGRPVVLKEYAIDPNTRRSCYKEAVLLMRLRHPSVMPIEAVFCDVTDSHAGVHLQMPYYKNGTLRDWWDSTSTPSPLAIAVLVQALLAAIAHLHAHGVIHCDIKPENILIDDAGRPRLADFDVSMDAKSRVTHTLTLRGTDQYIAPELRNRDGATPNGASDMYALGTTLLELLPDAPSSLRQLFDAMTRPDPADRLVASEALAHPLFEEVVTKQSTMLSDCRPGSIPPGLCDGERVVRGQTRTCCLCLCDPPHEHKLEAGLECSLSMHFTCNSCLTQHVHFASVDDLRERSRREGRIRCPLAPHGCGADAFFSDSELARHLSEEAFAEYLGSRRELVERSLAIEAEETLRQVSRLIFAQLHRRVEA